ncbi:hypothetical protein [Dactylosporangium sp. CA-139066]
MMWSVVAGLALVPGVWLLGSLAGVAANALAAEVRLNRQVRTLTRGRL